MCQTINTINKQNYILWNIKSHYGIREDRPGKVKEDRIKKQREDKPEKVTEDRIEDKSIQNRR